MADRPAHNDGIIRRSVAFVRSITLLAVVGIGVPMALVAAANARFGGAEPWAGVQSPNHWQPGAIGSALTDRLTDQTVADIVIRLALAAAWFAVIAFVITVIAETVHMLRHDGFALPDVRGLGIAQRTARSIAVGLLGLVPLMSSTSAALADTHPLISGGSAGALPAMELALDVDVPATVAAGSAPERVVHPSTERSADAHAPDRLVDIDLPRTYVVRPGDSVFAIAERLAGPHPAEIGAFAEAILDLNLGRVMPDGRRFDNAALLDVGWVLDLPDTGPTAPNSAHDARLHRASVHVVEPGESLWSIADDQLDDPKRWPDIFEANVGGTFPGGRVFDDPDHVEPGWALTLPNREAETGVEHRSPGEPTVLDDEVADRDDTAEHPAGGDTASARDEAVARPGSDGRVESVDEASSEGIDADLRDSGDPTDDVATADVGGTEPTLDTESSTDADDPRLTVDDPDSGEAVLGPGGGDTRDPARARPDREHEALPNPPAATAPTATDLRREIIWLERPGATHSVDPGSSHADAAQPTAPALLAIGGAAMLTGGVLALLGVRRQRQLRQAPVRARLVSTSPDRAATERRLRAGSTDDLSAIARSAIRSVATTLATQGARPVAVMVAADGSLELRTSAEVDLDDGWTGAESSWHLTATTQRDLPAASLDSSVAPCPALVQLGVDDHGRHVFVDLEAIAALEIGGPGTHAEAITCAIAATLAGSQQADVATLVSLGLPDEVFLGHRHHRPARSVSEAFEIAGEAIGTTTETSTFERRVLGTAGEAWGPALVITGAAAGTIAPPVDRTGLAVVSASPLQGPASRLAPNGDMWELLPAGIRITPIGLGRDDLHAIAELVAPANMVVDATADMTIEDDIDVEAATVRRPADALPGRHADATSGRIIDPTHSPDPVGLPAPGDADTLAPAVVATPTVTMPTDTTSTDTSHALDVVGDGPLEPGHTERSGSTGDVVVETGRVGRRADELAVTVNHDVVEERPAAADPDTNPGRSTQEPMINADHDEINDPDTHNLTTRHTAHTTTNTKPTETVDATDHTVDSTSSVAHESTTNTEPDAINANTHGPTSGHTADTSTNAEPDANDPDTHNLTTRHTADTTTSAADPTEATNATDHTVDGTSFVAHGSTTNAEPDAHDPDTHNLTTRHTADTTTNAEPTEAVDDIDDTVDSIDHHDRNTRHASRTATSGAATVDIAVGAGHRVDEPIADRRHAPTRHRASDATSVADVHEIDFTTDPHHDVEISIGGAMQPRAGHGHDHPDPTGGLDQPRLDHEIVVRLLGPVSVVDRDGNVVEFERSKTRELLAWMVSHRQRSTRSSARAALWELDVRDATFSNVVSEARRSLARLVEPPEGQEWVSRTMNDSLPLHPLVVSDAEVLEHALDVARLQPPDQAIATLTPAVEAITGLPFEGTSYLWPDSEGITSNLVLLATSAAAELAAHCLSVGDIAGVFAATSRGLQVLPAHEELIGLRMRAHHRAGDRAGVRQEWETYERGIHNDPWADGEPAPKLVELRRRLLQPTT